MSSLSMNGFLNYFGPQRFGLDDKEVNACDVGLAMLQGDMVTNPLYSNYVIYFHLCSHVPVKRQKVIIQ